MIYRNIPVHLRHLPPRLHSKIADHILRGGSGFAVVTLNKPDTLLNTQCLFEGPEVQVSCHADKTEAIRTLVVREFNHPRELHFAVSYTGAIIQYDEMGYFVETLKSAAQTTLNACAAFEYDRRKE